MRGSLDASQQWERPVAPERAVGVGRPPGGRAVGREPHAGPAWWRGRTAGYAVSPTTTRVYLHADMPT